MNNAVSASSRARLAIPQPPAAHVESVSPLDVQSLRADFPILDRIVHGKKLCYLDNAATTQKPRAVIDALSGYYSQYNANIHRGIHTLAEEATAAYESSRRKVARFLGVEDDREIVWTRNATEAINLVAHSLAGKILKPGDEILLTEMEHHANLIPWIMIAQKTGATLRHIPIDGEGKLRLETLDTLLNAKTRIFAFPYVSNVLGTINPAPELIAAARKAGVQYIVVDACQAVPHMPVNLPALGADFVAFSAHKMLGPTGVGVLWGKLDLFEMMDPYQGGGDMIREVRLDSFTWNDVPLKFEAGTPNIADVIAFAAAIDYLDGIGMEKIHLHEQYITEYALARLTDLGYINIYGPKVAAERAGLVAFNVQGIHPHDLSTLLDHAGVAIRAGHHCAQPLMRILQVPATGRASFYLYNDRSEIDVLISALREARKYFGYAS